jgi:tripartite-type tricarboxylate transporter receptor subunit TctC
MTDLRRRSFIGVGAAALAAPPAPAQRNDFPTRPIRIIVPYGPGGATDIVARLLADAMGQALRVAVAVENRPGGNGVIALQAVARARPDGTTLLVGNVTTNAINPVIVGPTMPVDMLRDLDPVARLVDVPAVFVATKQNFPPNSVAEVIEYARARPGTVNFTSAGTLSYSHLDFVQLQKRAGVRMTLIPSRAGSGSSQNDIITGDVQVAILNAATVLPLVQGGQIKALAVTPEARLRAFPDVPTMAEAGFPGIGTNAWQAMHAPAGTPPEIIARLAEAVATAMGEPGTAAQFARLMFNTLPPAGPEELRAWLRGEMAHWEPIVQDAKSQMEG